MDKFDDFLIREVGNMYGSIENVELLYENGYNMDKYVYEMKKIQLRKCVIVNDEIYADMKSRNEYIKCCPNFGGTFTGKCSNHTDFRLTNRILRSQNKVVYEVGSFKEIFPEIKLKGENIQIKRNRYLNF